MDAIKIFNIIREKLERFEKELKESVGVKRGNANQSDFGQFKTLDILNRFLRISRPGKELAIILTHKCNLSCAYCLRDAGSGRREEISYPKLKKIIFAADRFGIKSAGITGGEPFLYSRWKELIELIGNLKWRILWETNGSLVNEDALQFMKGCLGSNITFLVSLDSHKEEIHDRLRGEGAFKKAVAAIKLIKSRDFFLQTNVVITPLNMLNAESLVDYINFNKNLGVNQVSFNKAVNLGRGRNQEIFGISDKRITELRRLFEKHGNFGGYLKDNAFQPIEDDRGCARLGGEICLSPFGIHPCIFQEDVKIGEFKDFEKIFLNQSFLRTLDIIRLASVANYRGGYFSCAGCMKSLPGYLRIIKQMEILNGEEPREENKDKSFGYDFVLPKSFSILLTQKCNLKCDFCEFECSPEKEAAINIDDLEKLLHEGRKIGISEVVFDGGEPLVYGHIKEAMRLCRRYGYNATILTNGWHFQDYLPEFQQYNIRNFIFGINGATAKTNDYIMGKEGAFERLVKAIKKSKNLGFFTGLHLVIHPLNVKELDKFFKLAKKWKVDYIMISRIIEAGRAKDNPNLKITPGQIEEVRKIYQKHQNFLNKIQFFGAYIGEERSLQCKYLARDGHLSVHWNGEVALCSMTPLLNLPFKKVRDNSLLECLAAMNEVNRKFQIDRNKEFPDWRLSENPYFYCEYCHQKLIENKEDYFTVNCG